jgi:hypothetical protein
MVSLDGQSGDGLWSIPGNSYCLYSSDAFLDFNQDLLTLTFYLFDQYLSEIVV